MAIHTCEVKGEYFGMLARKEKTAEGRLNREKWSNMKIGDILYIRNSDMPDVVVGFVIVNVEYASNFSDLHFIYGKKLLPMLEEDDHLGAAKIYREIYSDNLVCYHGVVGLELKKIEE